MIDEHDYRFQVMNGSGNSFAITNFMSKEQALAMHEDFNCKNISEMALGVCHALKVDGFIILTEADSKENDYKWLFYNNDGSEAEMCGNAARCVGHFTFKNHIAGEHHSFESLAGIIDVTVKCESEIKILMPEIKNPSFNFTINFEKTLYTYHYINTGVPHSIIKIKSSANHKDYKSLARQLRASTEHYPGGSNVTFYSINEKNSIQSVSFERGVEDFTMACGTGAVAAAACHSEQTTEKVIHVKMPGGPVTVDLSGDKPYLIGPIEYEKLYFTEELKTLWMNSYTD